MRWIISAAGAVVGLALLGIWSCAAETAAAPEAAALPGYAPFLNVPQELIDVELASLSIQEKAALLVWEEGRPDGTLHPADCGGQVVHSAAQLSIGASRSLSGLKPGLMPVDEWSGKMRFPSWEGILAISDDSLQQRISRAYLRESAAMGASWLALPGYLGDGSAIIPPASKVEDQLRWVNRINEQGLLPLAAYCKDEALFAMDSSLANQRSLHYHGQLMEAGLAGIWLDRAAPANLILPLFRQQLQFDGLVISSAGTAEDALAFWKAGGDIAVLPYGEAGQSITLFSRAVEKGGLSIAELDRRAGRVLRAMHWSGHQRLTRAGSDGKQVLEAGFISSKEEKAEKEVALPKAEFLKAPVWDYWRYWARVKSIVLAANPGQAVPLEPGREEWQILHLPGNTFDFAFEDALSHYVPVQTVRTWAEVAQGKRLIILLDGYLLSAEDARRIRGWSQEAGVPPVVVNLGLPANLQQLGKDMAVLQTFGSTDTDRRASAQILFGGLGAEGRLPFTYSADFLIGQGEQTAAERLGKLPPAAMGIAPERLVGIDAIVQTAIDEGAFPGAQVLVAKDGQVIYEKAFGAHTYEGKAAVQPTDIFDLASITKVAATTLLAMQAYDSAWLEPKSRLRDVLDLPSGSKLRNLKLERLMTHQSGLQPHLPVIPYLLAREEDNNDCRLYFCREGSKDFPWPVAPGFFFANEYRERIWDDVQQLRSRRTRYRYSDANFYLVQQVLERQAGAPLDVLAEERFYQRLGLRATGFNPWRSVPLSDIVPTEEDKVWRHQLVHGYVHDETAALLGGVAGHAGLFSNARELAVLFQLLLNEGTYGGERYFSAEAVAQFTTARYGNHRGLGFDKPEEEELEAGDFPKAAGKQLFGHTGFTGTCAWADPQEGLIYIFLSNRIYPDRNNRKLFDLRVRERVHEVVYDALGSATPYWPALQ